jgi:hypothetical protein
VKGVKMVFFSLTRTLMFSWYQQGYSVDVQLFALIKVHLAISELISRQHIEDQTDIRVGTSYKLINDRWGNLHLLPAKSVSCPVSEGSILTCTRLTLYAIGLHWVAACNSAGSAE